MKKYLQYIIVLAIVWFAACEDDGISFSEEQYNGNGNDLWNVVNYDTSGTVGGHYYVDLGLSVMWATANIGASNPMMPGSYFAWGETVPKDSYTWDTYIHCSPSHKLTKYCFKKESGEDWFVDSLYTLLPEDDAAVQNWGKGWRMPTNDEFEELRSEKCHWEWISGDGINYYKVTGPNGKSILLPACGSIKDRERIMYALNGCIWSSSLSQSTPEHAYELTQYATGYWKGSVDRFYGEPIRPVIDSKEITNPSKH